MRRPGGGEFVLADWILPAAMLPERDLQRQSGQEFRDSSLHTVFTDLRVGTQLPIGRPCQAGGARWMSLNLINKFNVGGRESAVHQRGAAIGGI